MKRIPWNKNPITLICQECGKSFELSPSRKNKNHKHCSIECKRKADEKKWEIITCRYCGKKKKFKKSDNRKYCNGECWHKYQKTDEYINSIIKKATKKRLEKYNGSSWNKGIEKQQIIAKCLNCGKTFKVFKSQINEGHGKFCSRSCGTSGKFNNFYIHGNGRLKDRKKGYPPKWTPKLRKQIFQRDGGFCQICGKLLVYNYEKQVHHIDYNKKNCNPDNLILLCIHCHGKTQINRNYWMDYFLEG